MTTSPLASRSAAPTTSTLDTTRHEVIDAHAAAENALRMALCYLDKLNLSAARRKAVQALASINAMHRGSATDWMMPPSFHAAGKPPTTGGAQP